MVSWDCHDCFGFCLRAGRLRLVHLCCAGRSTLAGALQVCGVWCCLSLCCLLLFSLPTGTALSCPAPPRSPETLRDPRGFAVKFYTREGNFDLVGNNMPVSDAAVFPCLSFCLFLPFVCGSVAGSVSVAVVGKRPVVCLNPPCAVADAI